MTYVRIILYVICPYNTIQLKQPLQTPELILQENIFRIGQERILQKKAE